MYAQFLCTHHAVQQSSSSNEQNMVASGFDRVNADPEKWTSFVQKHGGPSIMKPSPDVYQPPPAGPNAVLLQV
jgi:hypothetical protein